MFSLTTTGTRCASDHTLHSLLTSSQKEERVLCGAALPDTSV